MAKIVNGTVEHSSPDIDGLSVGEVRTEYADILQITSGSRATVAGEEVGDSQILGQNDTVVFDQPTGSKGN